MHQRLLWLIPIAFNLGCIDLTTPWEKTQPTFDAACAAGAPGCASVWLTGVDGGAGTGGHDFDGSVEPTDAPIGGSARPASPEGGADAPVVGGQTAVSGTAGTSGVGGRAGSSGNYDAGAAGTTGPSGIFDHGGTAGSSDRSSGGTGAAGAPDAAAAGAVGTGGIVGYGGMGGSRSRLTGWTGAAGWPYAPWAGTFATGGIVGTGGMGGSSGGSIGGTGSDGAPDAGAAGMPDADGIVGAGGMGGSSGGSTSGAGAGGSTTIGCQGLADCAPTETCNSGHCVAPQGLVVLTVPLTTNGQNQRYAYPFSPAADLTNQTVTLRVYAPDASAGLLNIYLSMDNSESTPGAAALVPLLQYRSAWKDIVLNVGGVEGGFDPSRIKQVTIEVQSVDSGPWKNPTVVYIDLIAISALTLGDTFDSSAGGFAQSSTQAIPGSTLTWSGALP